jgi:ribonucleoside-triphosphate reductase
MISSVQYIRKRDGRTEPFNSSKITESVAAAAKEVNSIHCVPATITSDVLEILESEGNEVAEIEHIQNLIELSLIKRGHDKTSKAYILYRAKRNQIREMSSEIMRTYEELTFVDAKEVDIKRENANIDGDSPMAVMLRYGSEGAKKFNQMLIIDEEHCQAHKSGDIHIHDFEWYTLTTTCTQIDIDKLFKGGFNTGHGFLREPGEIRSYAALACIAIQANQNDQHGGQSIPALDHYLAKGVALTYSKELLKVLSILTNKSSVEDGAKEFKRYCRELFEENKTIMGKEMQVAVVNGIKAILGVTSTRTINRAIKAATKYTQEATYQGMEALVHNLNSMHSRAGSQVPFSSINYGTCTSVEGRLVIENVLMATDAGLGDGETAIFPIQIFKVKEGVNYNKKDPNYDLFKLACKVSAKRLFPNFSFLDAPFNARMYKEGDIRTEIAYMGCRTRVIGNVYDPENEVVTGRGNLNYTSINLPRIALECQGKDLAAFYEILDKRLELVRDQMLHRYKTICRKHPRNYPFLMGQGVWTGSEKLHQDDDISDILKNGTLSIGFIGLAETLVALTGQHHGESDKAQELGLEIVGRIREFCTKTSAEYTMNFTCLATPGEGLSERFLLIDRELYGVIPGVTDKNYYTNSFHIPVNFPILAYKKLSLEAPYHALTDAGHISYIELDGDTSKNLQAFEKVVRTMKELGIGYGAINHPVDRDPICGYTGIIDDVCPRCGRREGEQMTDEMWEDLQRKGYTMQSISHRWVDYHLGDQVQED